MERGYFGKERQPKRARPTTQDIQELMAQIGQIETEAKIAIIRPAAGLGKTLASLAAVFGLSAGIIRRRSNR